MRNLKRVLSLTLATVMLLGMMVVGAGAVDTFADLKDSADIDNQEAVALMVDLGIITGKPGSVYDPDAVVDRATMAVLITRVLMGKDVDHTAFKGTKTDLTDVDGTWAEGAIKFCYSNGIITGDGAGHFFPTQPVSVVQAAKMLLVALGRDAEDRGYVGSTGGANWSINIMRDAQSTQVWNGTGAGAVRALTDGLKVSSETPLTRDNAAQMIFNTLFVCQYEAQRDRDMGEKYISGYTAKNSLAGTTFGGLTRNTATVTAVSNGKITGATDKDGVVTNDIDDLSADADVLGKTVVYYTKGTSVVSTSVVAGATKVLATTTKGVTFANTNTKNDPSYLGVAVADDAVYYENGTQAASGSEPASAKRGAIVELIDSKGDGKADIVKITEKTVKTLTAAPKLSEDGKQVTITGVLSGATEIEKVKGYEDLKKGDVVLFVEICGVTYIEKAASIEGKVSGIKTVSGVKQMNINGTYYVASELVSDIGDYKVTPVAPATTPDFKNTYTFYLDDGKNIIDSVAVTDEAGETVYAVVLQYGTIGATGAIGAAGATYQAELLHVDGTTEVVEITKFGDNKIVTANKGSGEMLYSELDVAGNKGIFVSYKQDKNGKYELTPVADDGDLTIGNVASHDIENNKGSLFDGTNRANANTVFLTYNAKTEKYEMFKGVANVPAIASAKLTAGKWIAVKGITTYVYLNAEEFKGDESAVQLAYIINKDTYEVSADGYVFEAIIDGQKTTLTADAAAKIGSNGLVNYKTVDGVIEEAVTAVTTATGIDTVSGGLLVLGEALDSKTDFFYDDDTIVYVFDGDKVSTIAAADIEVDANDEVFVQVVAGSTDNTAEVIYIVKVAAPASGG